MSDATSQRTRSPFHPAVADWFDSTFGRATEVQSRAWAVTTRGRSALITAPTGSGKTLAAFLAAINELVVEGSERGLADEVQIVYVSPLKALSNDIDKNLQAPLRGIQERLTREMAVRPEALEGRAALETASDFPSVVRSFENLRIHHERKEEALEGRTAIETASDFPSMVREPHHERKEEALEGRTAMETASDFPSVVREPHHERKREPHHERKGAAHADDALAVRPEALEGRAAEDAGSDFPSMVREPHHERKGEAHHEWKGAAHADGALAVRPEALEGRASHAFEIRTAVRTGDTPASERTRMRRSPPHILVTTPESLYILLTSDSGREMLKSTRSVIVDELHAVAGSKRGAHLALTLERLEALCERPLQRIGLSATQKPIETMAALLMGARANECEIVDTGHTRERDLALEVPRSPLSAVIATEVWQEIYDRLAILVSEHRTTLIFVNQRRQAERIARHLAERIGEEHVTAHHGSLAREHRLRAEQRLKAGQLRALVATASLELGIDIGDVDLVCQIGSPRSINAFLQRVGRSGHAVNALPKGRLFPTSLDDLVESTALFDCVRRGELDRVEVVKEPLDVLAQQLVAEVGCREWGVEELHAVYRRALPYRELTLERFEELVRMLADGYSTRRGRRGALIHYDAVNRRMRARRGAKLVAVTNAGTIPDQFDYEVELAPEGVRIGTLNEDFAFESLPGDIVQLGNTSYRVLKVETGRVYVEDAKGQPPSMPFWFGEAPARSEELSVAVSRLRERADAVLREGGAEACQRWLQLEYAIDGPAAFQLAQYLAASHAALGLLPTRERIVFERFFDEVGDTHLVVHAPLGSRINRAWGLALRKRFCRQFNFELQAAALEDSLVLSLGPTHSFPLEEVKRYLNSRTAHDVLVQAVLQAPMFGTRWRWAASIALAVARYRGGRRMPPQWQRSDAEDLLTHAFPDALACQDNQPGDRDVPDHPLVQQALDDCLHEVMDVDGMIALLRRIENGEVEIVCRDLTAPSPLSESILNARPYAFLDDGEAEERRTNAVRTRGVFEPQSAADYGRLDPAAIETVRAEMRPSAANVDELHDALVVHGFLTDGEARATGESGWLAELQGARRVVRMRSGNESLWVAAERLHEVRALLPEASIEGNAPTLAPVADPDHALKEVTRSRLEMLGPTTATELGAPLGRDAEAMMASLIALETEGYVMRGSFTGDEALEWCERRRLARIHRQTRDKRRAAFEPVPAAAFMRFLLDWQGVGGNDLREGPAALEAVLQQLEGYPVAAAAWESEILPVRMRDYQAEWLDQLCASGRWLWQRPAASSADGGRKAAPVRATPILLLPREHAPHWAAAPDAEPELSGAALAVLQALRQHGASFFVDLVADSHQLRSHVEAALGELVSHGLVTSDGFSGLRALVAPAELKARRLRRGGLQGAFAHLEAGGRWALLRARRTAEGDDPTVRTEYVARTLLRRYGVVFRKLVERESLLPPWRELFYVLRRLEARGEIQGGRFVSGFSGEQFALSEAAATLRRYREDADEALVAVAGADPLNLTGALLPGERVPAMAGNRVLYRGGVPVAARVGGEVRYLAEADVATRNEWQRRLIRNMQLPSEEIVCVG